MALPFQWKQRLVGPPVDPIAPQATTTTAPETPVPLPSPDNGGLTDDQITELAKALRDRWHRPPPEETAAKAIECAELSGAFDDARAIAPLVAEWIAAAERSRTTGLLEAASMADRINRIGTTPVCDMHPADAQWWTAEPQSSLREAMLSSAGSTAPLRAVATWLRRLAAVKP